jgi:tryptophan-rich sensory protein
MLWLTKQLYIVLLFGALCFMFYYSRQDKWFENLKKPSWTKLTMLALVLAFFIIFVLWQCNPELSEFFIMMLVLISLWFMYMFGVSNYRLSVVVMILILINTVFGLMAVKDINHKQLIWIYILLMVIILYYNFRLCMLNIQ